MKYTIDTENQIISPTNPNDRINISELYSFLTRAFPDTKDKFSIVMGESKSEPQPQYQSFVTEQPKVDYANGTPKEYLVRERSVSPKNIIPGSMSTPFEEGNSPIPKFDVVVNDSNDSTPDNIETEGLREFKGFKV